MRDVTGNGLAVTARSVEGGLFVYNWETRSGGGGGYADRKKKGGFAHVKTPREPPHFANSLWYQRGS